VAGEIHEDVFLLLFFAFPFFVRVEKQIKTQAIATV
jgi:hypothetical protein